MALLAKKKNLSVKGSQHWRCGKRVCRRCKAIQEMQESKGICDGCSKKCSTCDTELTDGNSSLDDL